MTDEAFKPRSPLLLDRNRSAVLVIDVQEKLVPLINNHDALLKNLKKVIQGATILGIPLAITEQYPKGLGGTVDEISTINQTIPKYEKRMFSCRECSEIFSDWASLGINQIVCVGIESHVCVQQTVLDLLGEAFEVFVLADAIGSRNDSDHHLALRRMESSGATISTTESALFEWCETSRADEFKQISQLVQN